MIFLTAFGIHSQKDVEQTASKRILYLYICSGLKICTKRIEKYSDNDDSGHHSKPYKYPIPAGFTSEHGHSNIHQLLAYIYKGH